jgi:hypothetical protein
MLGTKLSLGTVSVTERAQNTNSVSNARCAGVRLGC